MRRRSRLLLMEYGKGRCFEAEWSEYRDPVTGTRVLQLTSHPSINHPTYFLNSAFTPDGEFVVFTSYRTGSPQLFEVSLRDGAIRQLTDGEPIHPFSAVIHPDGQRVFFVRKGSIWVLDRITLQEQLVKDFPGGQLGECSLSPDGQWLTAAIRQGDCRGLVVGKIDGTDWNMITFPRTVIHPQFHPLEPEWLEFAADPAPRMHRVRRDGTGLECLYQHSNDEFVVHETFLGKTGDLVFVVWPYALKRMDWTSRQIQTIVEFNAWHITPNLAGTAVLCDTNHPDRGIFLIEISTGKPHQVCLSRSTNQGSQWRLSRYALPEDFARARSEASLQALSWMEADSDTVYGPQYTHPHPSFSPDEKQITFASDYSGHTQVYVADIPEGLIEALKSSNKVNR